MRPKASVFPGCVLVMLLVGTVSAQTPAPTVVRWQYGASNSDLLVRNGLETVMLGQDNLAVNITLTVVRVSPSRQVVLQDALVEVINRTDQRVELVPSRITLDLVEPELKLFPYLDPDKLASNLRRMSHEDLMSDNANIEFAEDKTSWASDIERSAFRENTLLPNESISGHVFFAPPEHYAEDYGKGKLRIVLSVPVGDHLFKFPFWWDGNLVGGYGFPLWWKAKK